MENKERITSIIQKKKHDRPACICPGGMMNMVTTQLLTEGNFSFEEAHTDGEKMAQVAEYAYDRGCFENVGVPFCMTVEAEQLGAKVDLGDNTKEPRVIEYGMKKLEEVDGLPTFDLEHGRIKAIIDAIRIMKKDKPDVPVVGNITGPISTATSVIDPSPFYAGLRKKGELCHRFLAHVTKELIRFGQAMVEAGADIIMIADPSATGEILGPKFFEEFTVTYLNELIDGVKAVNPDVVTIVHICGQMTPVLEQTDHIKSDVLSFDAMVPLKEIRKYMKDRPIMGNVSTYAIEGQTPDKVKQLVHHCVEQGMDIISPACGLGMGSPLANVQAVLQGTEEEATCP